MADPANQHRTDKAAEMNDGEIALLDDAKALVQQAVDKLAQIQAGTYNDERFKRVNRAMSTLAMAKTEIGTCRDAR